MAIAELVALLESQTTARVQALLEEAEAEAERVRSQGAAEEEQARQAALAEGEARLLRAAALDRVEVERQDRAVVLQARQALLDRVRQALFEALPEVEAGEAWQARLPELVARLQAALGGAPLVLRCRVAPVLPALGGAVEGAAGPANTDPATTVQIALSPEAAPGLLGTSLDGRVAVDATLPTLLDRAWPALAVALLARFEGAPSAAAPAGTP